MSETPNYVGTATTLVGVGINAVQRAQEKDRQERIDAYNKELNNRNFHAQQIQNSPAYQMQRMKDAGWNPLASGITPDFQTPSAGDTLSPQPMETSSVGNAMIEAGQTYIDEKIRSANIELQKKALELKEKELEMQQGKILYEQQKSKLDYLVQEWNSGTIKHTDENRNALNDYVSKNGFLLGFQDDGNCYLKGIANIEELWQNIQKMQAEEKLTKQQLLTEEQNTIKTAGEAKISKTRGNVADEIVGYELSEKAMAIQNAIAYGENLHQDTRVKSLAGDYQEIANDFEKLEFQIYQLGGSNLPDYLKSKLLYVIQQHSNTFKALFNNSLKVLESCCITYNSLLFK